MTPRRFSFSAALTLLAVAWPASGAEMPAAEKWTFDRYEVVTGSTERQTVLSGFLLGGEIADLAVIHIDEDDIRHLRIWAYGSGAWSPRLDATLRPDVLFVDVAEIDGHDRLLTYAPGRLSWLDLGSETERLLAEVDSGFDPPRGDEIPHVDVTRDVNRDGRQDLVVPGVDGFMVFVQLSGGGFGDPVGIGRSPDLRRIYGADGYRFDPWSVSRVHEMDYDRDGRSDLVFWNDGQFEVRLRDEDGSFAPMAKTFTTEVSFDSDDLDALATGDMTGRVLHSLADLNGDGVGDLVVQSLEGDRISRKRSAYEVHFGTPASDGGTVFSRGVDVTFQSDDRIQIAMDRHDFDRDGDVDLMLTTVRTKSLEHSLWKRIKGFMGGGISLELEFYRADDGLDSDDPDAVHEIGLIGAPDFRTPGWVPLEIVLRGGTHERRKTQEGWARAFDKNLLIGDVTGDGRSDLLIEKTFRGLDLHVGVPGPELFARRPQPVAVIVPHDGEYTWLADLNRDGKQDVVMHHPFTLRDAHGAPKRPPGTEPHRVTLLIAH